jgi:uncharacterized membrane protein
VTADKGKLFVRWLFTLAVGTSGVLHMIKPAGFVAIVPASFPSPLLLVYVSGVAELAGAVGLQVPWPGLRRWASFGLMALFVAVFPANVNMALHDLPMGGEHLSPAVLWGRLALQPVLIWLAWWCTSRSRAAR